VRLLLTTCLAIGGAASAGAQVVSDDTLARVREKLQQPASTLVLDLRPANYTVYIEGRRPLADVFETPPWVPVPDELAAPKIGTGGVNDVALAHQSTAAGGSIDPGVVGHAISRAIRTRAARAEVKRSIAEYCSAHRDEPGADQICN
jgi:hypothetical protein